MAPPRVIRIDEEAWAELQQRARPFEDTPNTVLRRVLGLPEETRGTHNSDKDVMDERVQKLIVLVGGSGERRPAIRRTPDGSFAIPSEGGKTFGYIYPQKRRLKVEIRKDWAERTRLNNWDHELPNGWFNTGISSVYWYIPDGDDNAYQRVARIISKLRTLGS